MIKTKEKNEARRGMWSVYGGGGQVDLLARVVRKDLRVGSEGGSNVGIWGKSVFQAVGRASAKILR